MMEIFSLLLQGFLLLLFLYGFLNVLFNILFWMFMQSMLSRHTENVDNFVKEVDDMKESVKDAVDDMDNLILKYEAYENLILLRGDSRWATHYKPEEDFARMSAGASVINSSQSYTTGAEVCRRGFCWNSPRSPDVILEWNNTAGNCWAMEGSQGYVVIKLSREIYPTYVALDHLSRMVSYREKISSAPKDFSVYGMKGDPEEKEGTYLGTFFYNIDDYPTQAFNLWVENSMTFKYLRFRILSNWGHPNYTCIYGIHVNGFEM